MENPYNVVYSGISNLQVLKNTDEYAIAVFNYFGKRKYGLRWHGENGSIGTPSSHGKPTWFILPNELIEQKIVIDLGNDNQ